MELQNNVNMKGLPIGVIIDWMGNYNNFPAGFLLCDGTAVSRTAYAKLFAKLSTKFGIGDGSTTFNLPNLIDIFPQGIANSTTNPGSTGGGKSKLTSSNNETWPNNSTAGSTRGTPANHSHTITDVRPKYLECVPIIRA